MSNIRFQRSASRLVITAFCLLGITACSAAQAGSPPAGGRKAPPYPGAGAEARVGPDQVTVLPRGRVAFPLIRRLLAGAVRSVEVEMYELGNPDLTAAVLDARRRGVEVTVIDDPSVAATAATAMVLRGAGVDVVDYPVRRLMIDHVKLLVVDDRVAVVGGINWGAASAANHDFDAEIEGPAARNLARVFARDLLTAGRRVAVPDELPDPAIVVVTTLPQPAIRDLAVELVDEARVSLDLELFVLTDSGIVHAIERARVRGVAIRLLLDPGQRPSDRSVSELEAAGVPVRLYAGRGELLHAKAGVADGRRVLFGSANWTGGGFERNHELDVEVRDSAAVARTFTTAMDADWAASGG